MAQGKTDVKKAKAVGNLMGLGGGKSAQQIAEEQAYEQRKSAAMTQNEALSSLAAPSSSEVEGEEENTINISEGGIEGYSGAPRSGFDRGRSRRGHARFKEAIARDMSNLPGHMA